MKLSLLPLHLMLALAFCLDLGGQPSFAGGPCNPSTVANGTVEADCSVQCDSGYVLAPSIALPVLPGLPGGSPIAATTTPSCVTSGSLLPNLDLTCLLISRANPGGITNGTMDSSCDVTCDTGYTYNLAGDFNCDPNPPPPPPPAPCSYNGSSLASGSSVVAYPTSSVQEGSNCQAQTRTCTNGVLSGSYTIPSCGVVCWNGATVPYSYDCPLKPNQCEFYNQVLSSGSSLTAYQTTGVPAGSTCQSQVRTCTNGVLSGSYAYESCSVESSTPTPAPTIPAIPICNPFEINNGDVGPYPGCVISCDPGYLVSGKSCVPGPCSFGGQSIASGGSINAYLTSTVPFGQTCQQQSRTCTAGVLSGSYANLTCEVDPPAACSINGQTVASGATINLYLQSQATGNSTCTSQIRTCANGVLSGTAKFASCNSMPPSFTKKQVTSVSNVGLEGYAIYGSDTVTMGPNPGMMWFSGWMNYSDIGPGLIYSALWNGNQATDPAPIQWSGTFQGYNPLPYTGGSSPGYSLADPSVIYNPAESNYFMYYSALCDDYLHGCAAQTGLPPVASDVSAKSGWIGMAYSNPDWSSWDDSAPPAGTSWSDNGIVIGQDNGLDHTGARSPSALAGMGIAGSEIWVYYHTNTTDCADPYCLTGNAVPSRVLRSRLIFGSGTQMLGTDALRGPGGAPIQLINVNVQYAEGYYWLIGSQPNNTVLVLERSIDGLNFFPYNGTDGILINFSVSGLSVITPRIEVTGPDTFNLFFSYGTAVFPSALTPGKALNYVAEWKVQLN